MRAALLVVTNPSGNRSRVPIDPLPFLIGRNADNHLVLRDNRISRAHARVVAEQDQYYIEDLQSRHGVFVNQERVTRRQLADSDVIEFGSPDSYRLTFSFEERELDRILDQIAPAVGRTPGSNLGKLRALVEVARTLQSSLSADDVLTAVVDAALVVTGTERGFLMLRKGDGLETRVARDCGGVPLAAGDLAVPSSVIQRALNARRELLSMSFDPFAEQGMRPDSSIAHLELRSVVCVPLVRVRSADSQETFVMTPASETAGVLYMDSRGAPADLSHGNRELLQTLALEASTVLENARLLEEERARQRLEEELSIARAIQNGLLPHTTPSDGWFRAAGSSLPSAQVGGDFFDVRNLHSNAWLTMVADVSGKGVSSALLASLLQGAFLLASDDPAQIKGALARVNRHLLERTRGEKYATVFYGTTLASGVLQWANAGHCEPILLHSDGQMRTLETTGLPLGMLESADYTVESVPLEAGDKVIVYSDGLTEAENRAHQFFGMPRLKRLLREYAGESCHSLHARILDAVNAYTLGTEQSDDITLLVFEYQPEVRS